MAYDGRGYVSPYPQHPQHAQHPQHPQHPQQSQPISLPSSMSAPWLTMPSAKKESGNSYNSSKGSQLGRSRSRGAGSSRRRSNRQDNDSSAAASAADSDLGRKVTFNAFATVQLVD